MEQATVGRQVLVFVHPGRNLGQDYAPATITHVVSAGEPHSVVHVQALIGGQSVQLQDVPLLADVDAAHEHLAEHYQALMATPGADKRGWERSDAYRWVTAAFWPPRATPAAKPESELTERVTDSAQQ